MNPDTYLDNITGTNLPKIVDIKYEDSTAATNTNMSINYYDSNGKILGNSKIENIKIKFVELPDNYYFGNEKEKTKESMLLKWLRKEI
jgi:hypothetical protein